jgi:NADPH2:quinone reductase
MAPPAEVETSVTYHATVLALRGGPEALEIRELPMPEPRPGEVRVRVRASGVGAADVAGRRGWRGLMHGSPFVPGREVVGTVDEMGEGVAGLCVGQRVAALIAQGGWGEVVVRPAEELVPVPEGLYDVEVVALILNYVAALQMIERVARPQPGRIALVSDADGGVGTALLELLRLRGVRAIGAAAPARHELLRSLGATPLPSPGAPLDRLVRRVVPDGVDAAFVGLGGGRATAECVRATRRGGLVVGYGLVGTRPEGGASRVLLARGLLSLLAGARLAGRRASFYGVAPRHRRDPRPFREDLARLLALLASRRIQPRIAARLPLLEARRAVELLETGGLEGEIVLVA